MGGAEQKTPRAAAWGITIGILVAAVPAAAQQATQLSGPGDQIFSFGIDQTFAANDNIRLDPTSAGTTYYSDTKFTFGFTSQTAQQQFNFDAAGIWRMVDDPVIGTDAEFRDPSANLFFNRTNGREQITLYANYDRPDLAFLDPLQQVDINGQDITNGAGTREDIRAGVTLETGLQGPLGFLLDVNTRQRNYDNTTDPALFDNQTNSAFAQVSMQFTPVSTGRFYASASEYEADDTVGTRTETITAGLGLDRALDPATMLSFDLGYSKVKDTEDNNPAFEDNFEGYVGGIGLVRTLPNGQFTADLDSALNRSGRQSTFEIGRDYTLPLGSFGFTVGATTGDDFDVRPVGSLSFVRNGPTSRFDARLVRTVRIDETLDQLTETTRVSLGYNTQINPLSSIDIAVSYADIAVIGNNNTTNPGRERLGATAAYVRDVGQDWQLRVGYGYRMFSPDGSQDSESNEVFFSLQKTLDIYR